MNEQLPSYRISDDDVHVREPSYRNLYDRSKGHSYSHVSSSDLEAGTAPLRTRKWTKSLGDGFVTVFRALARKEWNMTATFEDMAEAALALLKLVVIVAIIASAVVFTIFFICVFIWLIKGLIKS
ncbi:hypothetical protein CDV55_108171 [Aspergillus turcosus]|nr:hypothetical protein CDV55_108171 [Aspergillus turcosus]